MALPNEIAALRDRALTELGVAYDYYSDTKIAWRLVHELIAAGRKFTIRNNTTRSVTTHAELAGKSRGYVTEQLTEATFQQFVSLFENFCFDLLRLWLTAFPQSLGAKKVDFKSVLDLPDKDAITQLVVGKELNEVLYDRPAGWFAYLEDKVGIECPSPNEIEQFAEIKASRDVLVHNRGIANKIYGIKAGNLARFADGNRIEVSEYYHRQTWELLRKIIADISDAAIAKAP